MEELRQKTRIRILHVTDVHSALHNIVALKTRLETRGERIDLILLSGDNADMEIGARDLSRDAAKIARYEKDMELVIRELESIHSLVVYVPGNHDPITTFDLNASPMTSTSMNLHRKCMRLAGNLCIIGFGGSIPAFKDSKLHWEGFPFETEEDLAKELDPLLQFKPLPSGSNRLDAIEEGDSVILMTHFGPSRTDTTIVYEDISQPILSGSETLRCHLEGDLLQKFAFLNIHGHSHDALGKVQLGNVTISNPGPLREGNYGLYTICKGSKSWRLTSCTYEILD
ncbi:uncharacterized protein [Oscarella lobularis]|uniref:uncharacterized protein n=1 Tax=Oscarella lobularis TaxID=121494 RepID=UPI00331422F0